MLKVSACIFLLFIGFLYAANSCDSCGNECVGACGTRHFRSCCFNYLRRKRVSDEAKFWTTLNDQPDTRPSNRPIFLLPSIPVYYPDIKTLVDVDENRLNSDDLN